MRERYGRKLVGRARGDYRGLWVIVPPLRSRPTSSSTAYCPYAHPRLRPAPILEPVGAWDGERLGSVSTIIGRWHGSGGGDVEFEGVVRVGNVWGRGVSEATTLTESLEG